MYNVRKMRCCFIHLSSLPDHLCSIKHHYPLQKLPQFILRYCDNVFVCRHIAVTEAENCVTWFWSRYLKTQCTCGQMQGTYSDNDQNMGTFLYIIPYSVYIFVVPDTTKTNSAKLKPLCRIDTTQNKICIEKPCIGTVNNFFQKALS